MATVPRIYAVASAVLVAVVGALGSTHVIDSGTAQVLQSVVALVVTQLAHFAPSPKPPGA